MAALGRLALRTRSAGQQGVIVAAAEAWKAPPNARHTASCHLKPPGFATVTRRSFMGFRFKDGGFQSIALRPTPPKGFGVDVRQRHMFFGMFKSKPQPNAQNNYGVDTRERDEDEDFVGGHGSRLRRVDSSKDKDLVRVQPESTNDAVPEVKAVSETALDKGSNVATTALDNIGDILTKTGLEVELDVSLQELSIEKLVLKDLGLVLVIKTKPQKPQSASAQAASPPPPSPQGSSPQQQAE